MFYSGGESSTSGIKRSASTAASSESSPKRNKHDFNIENDYVVVYVDGACENNGKSNAKAGIGIWFGDNNPL